VGHDRTHAPQHRLYSITLSAIASSVRGNVRPSALTVLRLITNLTLVGRITGRFAGFQSAVAKRSCGLTQKDSAGLAQALRIRPEQRIDTAFNEFDPEWNIRRTGDAGAAQP
jgi:hypothetical protein